jgi:hypothetical protein
VGGRAVACQRNAVNGDLAEGIEEGPGLVGRAGGAHEANDELLALTAASNGDVVCGTAFPRWVENDLRTAPGILRKSVDLALQIFADVRAFATGKGITLEWTTLWAEHTATPREVPRN